MSKRRNFLKALVALPVVAKATAVSAEPVRVESESNVKVICPHCFELTGRAHTCEGFLEFKARNKP